jgi:3-oxoacyl-[acyl-carrier-protein] synthase II
MDALRAGHLTEQLAQRVALGPADIGCTIANALGLKSAIHTSIAACSSGLHAFHRALRSVEFGETDRALVIAADASHHDLFEASFERLGVLASPDSDGCRRCRPFDRQGDGFIVSEAAAAILIERAMPNDNRVRVARSIIAADSTGLIAIDPAGDSLAQTLIGAVRGVPLHFVHAHATGTAHDAIEVAAIRTAGHEAPIVSSKRWIGHSLGAAGLVALALSHRAHCESTLWDGKPLPPHSRSLTISQGFGGHIAAVVLES